MSGEISSQASSIANQAQGIANKLSDTAGLLGADRNISLNKHVANELVNVIPTTTDKKVDAVVLDLLLAGLKNYGTDRSISLNDFKGMIKEVGIDMKDKGVLKDSLNKIKTVLSHIEDSLWSKSKSPSFIAQTQKIKP